MDIVIDFDGTCVTHEFPEVGKDIGATPILKQLVVKGHRLILFTMRSNNGNLPLIKGDGIVETSGNFLDDAVNWFKDRGIDLFGIQTNPTQNTWTTSPKAYGQLIIDDAALGCPLIFDTDYAERPFVDWDAVGEYLKGRGIL